MASGGHRFGTGRKKQHPNVEDFRSIDVRRFAREAMLRPGSWMWTWRDAETREPVARITVDGGDEAIRLRYVANGTPFDMRIAILRTACGFGGHRPWFGCPRCGARVAILYISGAGFACRCCHGLVYSIQSVGDMTAAWRRAHRVGDLLGPNWSRPKGMHHSTCARLQSRAYRAMTTASALMGDHFERIELALTKLPRWLR